MVRRTSTGRGVALSHLEFDLLWNDLTEQQLPYPLDVPSHGATMAEREELGVGVFADLEQAGLIDGHDIDNGLESLMDLLNHPSLSMDALVFGVHALRVLAASKEHGGVLAVLDENEVILEPARADQLVAAVMSRIGDLPGGPGNPVRVTREVFSAAIDTYARHGYNSFERVLAEANITGRDVRAFATLVGSARKAAGQVAANGPAGRSPVLSWYDTEAGRYAVTVQNVGQERLATLSPANGAWIAHRLKAMLDLVVR